MGDVDHDAARRVAELTAPYGRLAFASDASAANLGQAYLVAMAELERLRLALNTPELVDFAKAVRLEAAHQRERWGTDHDAGKSAADWFWLVGYLAGKALHADTAGNREKTTHHIITTAAALANWHAAVIGADNRMRPGIDGESPTQQQEAASDE